jgi:hypothetical protein
MFENRVLRRIFGHKRDDVTPAGESYIMRSSTIFTLHQKSLLTESRKSIWTGHVLLTVDINAHKMLIRKSMNLLTLAQRVQ